MDVEGIATLLGAVIPLIQALSWPLIVLFILIAFGGPIKRFLESLEQFTFKADLSGLEASARTQQIEAAALLGAAAASKAEKSPTGEGLDRSDWAHDIASAVSQAVQPGIVPAAARATALWVDANPSSNTYERGAMEALGIRFSISPSTEDALEKLRLRPYDVIISDTVIPPDEEASYPLLKGMHRQGHATPLVTYAGAATPEHRVQARRRGAFACAGSPEELFAVVLSALERGATRPG